MNWFPTAKLAGWPHLIPTSSSFDCCLKNPMNYRFILLITSQHRLHTKHSPKQFFCSCIMWLSLRQHRENHYSVAVYGHQLAMAIVYMVITYRRIYVLQYYATIVFLLIFLYNIHQKLKKHHSHIELVQGRRTKIIIILIQVTNIINVDMLDPCLRPIQLCNVWKIKVKSTGC
jgi:hypothetical protein